MKAQITSASQGKTFTMRLVRKGDAYGRNNCLTHDKDDPLVEFYDTGHSFDRDPEGEMLGQFVTRYYASTLLEGTHGRGLCLDGGVPAWTLDTNAYDVAVAILANWSQ